jgi:GNAT superfamily N-acetyltransferase
VASSDLELKSPPPDERRFELWLQHAAGRILFEDVRGYALERIDAKLSPESRAVAEKAINDTLYGLMMVIDGVTGELTSDELAVELSVAVRLVNRASREVTAEIDLKEGDGMCMGYHGWIAGDYGEDPVAQARDAYPFHREDVTRATPLRRLSCQTLGAMRVEPATVSDAAEISALIVELSEPFYLLPSREGAEPFLSSVSAEAERGYMSAGNFSYYVAKSNNRLAGIVALRDNSHLFHLFVAKAFQGKGLASQLWRVAKAEAQQAGNPGEFTVNSSLNAVPVYERFGFVRQGEVQRMHGIFFQPMRLRSGQNGA